MALAVATAMSVLTAIVAAQLIGSEPSSASSAAVYAFTGGSNPVFPFTPPSTDGVDDIEGLFSKTYTDISVPGLGPGLDLTRTYGGAESLAYPTFGTGWAFSYGMAVVENSNSSPTQWTVFQENGSPAGFSSCPTTKSGSCTNASGQADVSLSFNLVNNVPSYTFTRAGVTFTFGLEQSKLVYALTKITAPDGYSTTVNWTVSAPSVEWEYGELQLQSVTDAEGRSITFAYNSAGTSARPPTPWVGSPPTATTPPAPATSWSRSPSPTAR